MGTDSSKTTMPRWTHSKSLGAEIPVVLIVQVRIQRKRPCRSGVSASVAIAEKGDATNKNDASMKEIASTATTTSDGTVVDSARGAYFGSRTKEKTLFFNIIV